MQSRACEKVLKLAGISIFQSIFRAVLWEREDLDGFANLLAHGTHLFLATLYYSISFLSTLFVGKIKFSFKEKE